MGIDASVAYPPIIDNQFRFLPSLAGSTVSHRARFVAGWATITYAARHCLAAAIDIQYGEIVGWEVESRYKLWLIRKTPKPKKRKKRLRGVFQQNHELFRIPGL
jgi:hypothetical protein